MLKKMQHFRLMYVLRCVNDSASPSKLPLLALHTHSVTSSADITNAASLVAVRRYEFVTRNQHVVMAVSSKLGKVFMAAGATDEATFPGAARQLKAAVDSFQLVM